MASEQKQQSPSEPLKRARPAPSSPVPAAIPQAPADAAQPQPVASPPVNEPSIGAAAPAAADADAAATDADQSPAKRARQADEVDDECGEDGGCAKAQSPPDAGTVAVCKDEAAIIYPNSYERFIPIVKNITCSGLLKSRDGGGFMSFLTLGLSAGSVPAPILIQTPPLVTPSGAITFKDGKSSMVLSMGQSDDEWMNCPQKAAFYSLMNSIDEAACQAIAAKGWARVGPVSEEDARNTAKVREFYTPTLDRKDSKKDPTKKYSLGAHVSICTGPIITESSNPASVSASKQRRTRFFAIDGAKKIREVCMSDVEKLSVVRVLCEVAWIYRRTPTKYPAFSLRLNAVEVVVQSTPGQDASSGCHIDPSM